LGATRTRLRVGSATRWRPPASDHQKSVEITRGKAPDVRGVHQATSGRQSSLWTIVAAGGIRVW